MMMTLEVELQGMQRKSTKLKKSGHCKAEKNENGKGEL
jgi:hypothetical protein